MSSPWSQGADTDRPTKHVNTLLAMSRAEHARHLLNVTHARRTLPSTAPGPSLPSLLIAPAASPSLLIPAARKVPGPAAPRSWLAPRPPVTPPHLVTSPVPEAVLYRTDMLRFIYSHLYTPHDLDALPTLADHCLLSMIVPDFEEDAVSSLPPHLRSKLARLAAVHSPLTRSELLTTWGEDFSGMEGEVVIVGNEAYPALRSLLDFLRAPPQPPEDTWDTPLYLREVPQPLTLHSLILMDTHLPPFSSLPPSITHLALLSVPFDPAKAVKALPKAVPLLEWLDLSGCDGVDFAWCDALEWRRWIYLSGVRLRLKGGEDEAGRDRVRRAIGMNRDRDVEVTF